MIRIVVAMSGGVDSSVAAALVARAGYETIGVTLRLMPKLETGFGCCGSPKDIDDAKRVCETLGVPHYTLDLAELFESKVIRPFVDEYLRQRTPNPCVECNRSVKFGYLLALARAWGADAVATGHYARLKKGRLYRAADEEKDQSYFLYSLTPAELSKLLLPLGKLSKAEVRRIAHRLGLATADKEESQEICFVPRRDYRAFLRSRASNAAAYEPGEVRDGSGAPLGRHEGLANYTIGQRRGLRLGSFPQPMYVTGMDSGSNVLTVGPREQTFRGGLEACGVSWTVSDPPVAAFRARVRIRHRHAPAQARITPLADARARVDFDEPQRSITPGQAAVFYADDGELLGGGTIDKVIG